MGSDDGQHYAGETGMKNENKWFILIEAVLAAMVTVLAVTMFLGRSEKEPDKISVIVRNSDDSQWAAFKYGLKMAAEDRGANVFIVSTGTELTEQDVQELIRYEMDNGAAGVILQPLPGMDMEKLRKMFGNRVSLMLVEDEPAPVTEQAFSVVQADHYRMGKALAEDLLKDYSGSLNGKTIGILSEEADSEATKSREKGFREGLEGTGAEVVWSVSGSFAADGKNSLGLQPKVDCVIALDDHSLRTAGECAAAKNLHGALVYGIGKSTEAVYYLDTGIVESLVVADEFNIGYQSLTEVSMSLNRPFYKAGSHTIPYTVIRSEDLFSEENQEILFTMSQ